MTPFDQLPPTEPRRATLVEDDERVRRSLQLLLHWRGYEVRSFASATNLLDAQPPHHTEVLIIDDHLPDADGLQVLGELLRRGWSGRSVLMTASATPDVVEAARACGYDEVLEKPLRHQALIAALAP